jgi:hypothetical protein
VLVGGEEGGIFGARDVEDLRQGQRSGCGDLRVGCRERGTQAESQKDAGRQQGWPGESEIHDACPVIALGRLGLL